MYNTLPLHLEPRFYNIYTEQTDLRLDFRWDFGSPVQQDMPLQVALMGSWHGFPTFSYIQFLQQALFLSLPTQQEHRPTVNPGALTGTILNQDEISFITCSITSTLHSSAQISQPQEGALPALLLRLQLAVGFTAGVGVEVDQPGVALLSLLHPRVPTHLTVPLLKT